MGVARASSAIRAAQRPFFGIFVTRELAQQRCKQQRPVNAGRVTSPSKIPLDLPPGDEFSLVLYTFTTFGRYY